MAVRERLSRLLSRPDEGVQELVARIEALEADKAKLEKRLNMAMGAIQASTTQLMQLKEQAAAAGNQAQQAMQRATSASSTAEAAADGVAGVEEQLAALMESLGTEPAAEEDPKICKVEGCSNKVRARGYCAKHYQQFKRGTL